MLTFFRFDRYYVAMSIKDRVRIILQGDPIISSVITRDVPLHGWTHEAGGIDEISIADLSGIAGDEQRAGWLEDYDIDLSVPPTDNQVLMWDATNEYWYAADVDTQVTAGVVTLNTIAGHLNILGSDYIDVDTTDPDITITMLDHAIEHQNAGGDEIDVTDLSGRLADDQFAGWFHSIAYPISSAVPTVGQALAWDGGSWIPTTITGSVTGLTPERILYGSATGTIEQSANLYWDGALNVTGDTNIDGNITLQDNHITGVIYLDITQDGVSSAEGRLWNDSNEGYLVWGMPGGVVNLQIGGEQLLRGRNDSGSEIANGMGARVSGATGNNPLFDDIDISLGNACTYAGMATEALADHQFGYLNTFGLVRDFDTSALTVATKTYWSATGGLTHTQPAAGLQTIMVGYPLRVHATEGVFLHTPHCTPYLSYLSDVNARDNAHTEGNVLAWDATEGYWDLSPTVMAVTHDTDTRFGDVHFYEGSGIIIDQAADGFILSALIADIVYTADTVNIDGTYGTYISGTVADTHTVNLIGYVVQEVSGAPGLVTIYDFVDVELFDRLQCHVLYQVNPTSHIIEIELYNYNTTSWDSKTNFTYSNGYQTIDVPIADSSDYVDGSGDARVRFYHTANGSTQHQLDVDYLALVRTGGASAGCTLGVAYNFGGPGVGRIITADAGSVDIIVPPGGTNRPLKLNNLEPTNSSGLISLYDVGGGHTIDMNGVLWIYCVDDMDIQSAAGIALNTGLANWVTLARASGTARLMSVENDGTGEDIIFSGTKGDTEGAGLLARGHELWCADNGALSIGTTRHSDAVDKASAWLRVTPYYQNPDRGRVFSELYATSDTSSDEAYIRVTARGNTGYEAAWVEIFGDYVLGSSGAVVRNFQQYVGPAIPTTPTVTSGVIDFDCTTGRQSQAVTITADVTEIDVTDPVGIGEFYLRIEASGANRDVENFTSDTSTPFTFIGNYDLNTDAITIPSGAVLLVKMVFHGATLGWDIQAVLEVN